MCVDLDQTVSPVSVAHFSQYKLTRLILQHLQNVGFTVKNPNGLDNLKYGGLKEREILMGHECVSVNATSDCVTMTASYLNEEGKHSEKCVRSRLLVGTDGAGSTVRQLLGIDMRGEKDLQKLVSVHFMSKQLGEYLINERPGMLFFIFNTEAIGVLVAHDLKEGEFVLQVSCVVYFFFCCIKLLMININLQFDYWLLSCRYPFIHLSRSLKILVRRYSFFLNSPLGKDV